MKSLHESPYHLVSVISLNTEMILQSMIQKMYKNDSQEYKGQPQRAESFQRVLPHMNLVFLGVTHLLISTY